MQIGIIILALVLTFVAILVFSGVLPGIRPSGSTEKATLKIWGPIPKEEISEIISDAQKSLYNITLEYSQRNSASIESDYVSAIASGQGPDIVILPSDSIIRQSGTLFPLSEMITKRDFQDTFADAAGILDVTGIIYGLPLTIDPLILYWNKDMFQSASISRSPGAWDEFVADAKALTKIDSSGNIIQSGAALGLFSNISHPKEILSALAMQAGDPIVERATLNATLGDTPSNQASAMENALRFYTEFAGQNKASFSWSPSLPKDIGLFERGDLAMYFGFASEAMQIRDANPHLNFDVASIPQIRGLSLKITFGRFLYLAISKSGAHIAASWSSSQKLTDKYALQKLADHTSLPPSRRDLLQTIQKDPIKAIFWQEAVRSRNWLDANPQTTSDIFRDMVNSVYSGSKTINEAVRDASVKFKSLYQSR